MSRKCVLIAGSRNMEKELPLEEAENHKEFFIGVQYYNGIIPYAILYENREEAWGDIIYKIKIPYKNESN